MELETLEQSLYFSTVLEVAMDSPMRQRRHAKRVLSQGYTLHLNRGDGWETINVPYSYEENYCYPMTLTPSGAARIIHGKPKQEDLEALEMDLEFARESGLFLPDQVVYATCF